MNKVIWLLLSGLLLIAAPAHASGSGSYGGYSTDNQKSKRVDETYEYGKAIYKGRVKSVGKISFCLAQGDQLFRAKRGSLKGYSGGSFQQLANDLVNCKNPDEQIIAKIGEQKTRFLLHYLNKRYKLKLR